MILVILCSIAFAGFAINHYTKSPQVNADAEAESDTFDPRRDVSADAKYIVKHLVLWFLVLPLLLGIIVLAISKS